LHTRLMIFLALTREEPIGTIRPDGEVMHVHYPTQESHRRAARLQRRIAMEFDALFKPLSERKRERKLATIERRKVGRGWASVHQCGGAAMAEDISRGVVDHRGEVFNYPGLYVSDASIFPAAPCCGPHYTILAQSDRISRQIIADAST
jgi:choline dehydrogenase-like flavoprotein